MFNAFVPDDEAGFFSALQAHLYARWCAAGITVKLLKPHEADSATQRLLAALDTAAATGCALPAERHVLFIGLVPSPAWIRRLDKLTDDDPTVRVYYLKCGKYTFQKFYNCLSAPDREELLFSLMDLLPQPQQREHNTKPEEDQRKGRP